MQQVVVSAALDLSRFVREVVLNNVELVFAEWLLLFPKGEPLSDLETGVIGELLNGPLQGLLLLVFVVGQPYQRGQPARPHCALLQVDLRDQVFEDLAVDVFLAGLPAHDAEDLEVDAAVVGGGEELGEFPYAGGLGLAAQLGDLEVHDLDGLGLDELGVLLLDDGEHEVVDELILFGVGLEDVGEGLEDVALVLDGHVGHGLLDAEEQRFEVGLAADAQQDGGRDGGQARVAVVQHLLYLLHVYHQALPVLVLQQVVEDLQN